MATKQDERSPGRMRSDDEGSEDEEDQIGAFLDAIENSNLEAADALIGGRGSDDDLSDEEGAVMALLAESDAGVELGGGAVKKVSSSAKPVDKQAWLRPLQRPIHDALGDDGAANSTADRLKMAALGLSMLVSVLILAIILYRYFT